MQLQYLFRRIFICRSPTWPGDRMDLVTTGHKSAVADGGKQGRFSLHWNSQSRNDIFGNFI